MQRRFASLVLMLFTFMTVSAQNAFTLPDDLSIITPENVTQLTPLAQLGGATPGITRWSPDGQTLLAQSSDGVHQYNLGALDTPEFFETLQYIEYSATGRYAIERGRLLDGSTLVVIDDTAYFGFTADGSVLISSDEGEIHLADAETLEEFGTLPTSGSVVLSEDRRCAAVWGVEPRGPPGAGAGGVTGRRSGGPVRDARSVRRAVRHG